MKEFSCGDIVPGCTAKFRDATEDDILAQVDGHGSADHDIESVLDELADQVCALIHPCPASVQ